MFTLQMSEFRKLRGNRAGGWETWAISTLSPPSPWQLLPGTPAGRVSANSILKIQAPSMAQMHRQIDRVPWVR